MVGGRHNSYIGLDRSAASDRCKLSLLQHSKKPSLRVNWHITLCYVVIETMINDNTDDPHIVFRDVDKLYGSTLVLERVALEARRGDFVSIIGPSGSGKTTISRLLFRFYDPQSGAALQVADSTHPQGQLTIAHLIKKIFLKI